jgi:NAD(P)-dependent dehydrogenase (short-subunit alcohol dehydrogenase family)
MIYKMHYLMRGCKPISFERNSFMRIDDLRGQAVLVTGSSTGIGAAVAEGFGAQGMRVAVHGNSNMAAAEAVAERVCAAGGEAIILRADLRDRADCTRLVEEAHAAFGRLDVLVNNAGGVVRRTPIRDAEDALFDEVLALNATSVFACSRAALKFMALSSPPPRSPRAMAAAGVRCSMPRLRASSPASRGVSPRRSRVSTSA